MAPVAGTPSTWSELGGSPGLAAVAVLLGALAAGTTALPAARDPRDRVRPAEGPGRGRTRRWRSRVFALAPTSALPVVIGSALTATGRGGVPLALGVGAGLAVECARRRRLARTTVAARRLAVIEMCTALAGELRAGRPARDALATCARDAPELLGPAVLAAGTHGDVAGALARSGGLPGARGLCHLAACWAVADSTGAGLAAATDRLAESLRFDESVRREVATELAGPRATARLLALLPLAGLLLGAMAGADPLRVLLETPYGLACLTIGLALQAAGLVWTERLARAAEPPP